MPAAVWESLLLEKWSISTFSACSVCVRAEGRENSALKHKEWNWEKRIIKINIVYIWLPIFFEILT